MKKNIKKTGFTLIEVMISIAIFTVLMTAISIIFLSLYRQQGADFGMIQRTHDANNVIDMMSVQIRKANRAENGNFTLATATASSLTFYSDIDNDGLTEKVSYFLQGTDLKKNVIEPGTGLNYPGAGTTSIICGNVQNGTNPIFTYYNNTYTGTGNSLALPVQVLNVRVIGIALDLNSIDHESSYPLHVETKVQLRNSE
jgi:prepilin-type N-terminal cleavage/methylation domain-containing protein